MTDQPTAGVALKPKKRFAFEVSGRWTQIQYVDAHSVKEARELFSRAQTSDTLDWTATRTGVKRAPAYDEVGQ